MTFEIAIVLGILAISLVLFVSEVIRMDLVALLVLGTLAVSGLVTPPQAFAGFSNSAVITVWAMFILSEGLAPETAMMAIALAASASFTSPISHPANILVMGPGGYRFVDYLKIGVPLTLVIFVTVMFLLPIFWPLVPAQ